MMDAASMGPGKTVNGIGILAAFVCIVLNAASALATDAYHQVNAIGVIGGIILAVYLITIRRQDRRGR